MKDFAARLEETFAVLQKINFEPKEEPPALIVQVAKQTAIAMISEMLVHLRSGSSEVEVMAAVRYTVAFVVNTLVYCSSQSHPNYAAADRVMALATRMARELGDGATERFITQRQSVVKRH